MNNATSPANARFWVRPYEFEGDGSHGAAEAVASLEVGGKTRAFWLKTLENRLFFREVGRDEAWNFGALEQLSGAEQSNLLLALANVLASENYGRVVLPVNVPRPCYLLAAPNGRIRCGVPQNLLHAFFERKPSHTMFNNHFLDWRPGTFHVVARPQFLEAEAPSFWEELSSSSAPLVDAQWNRGSQPEWEKVLGAFFFRYWSQIEETSKDPFCIVWQLESERSMQEGEFYFCCASLPFPSQTEEDVVLDHNSRKLLRYIKKQFSFVGQQESAWNYCEHLTARGTVYAPTQHEILEAHLFLRDWINQRLTPERARKWLDFS